MAKDNNTLYIVIAIVGIIILAQLGVFNNLFTVQLSRDTIFLDSDHLNTVNLEVRQESASFKDSHLIINYIKPSSITTRGPDPHSRSYWIIPSDGVSPPYGTGACKGLVGWSSSTMDQCCRDLGYERYYSDTGWNICVGTSQEPPQYVKISVADKIVYTWDGTGGLPTAPQNSMDFSDAVNSACGFNTPLSERSYATKDCNNLGTDYAYNSTWAKCIKLIDRSSTCDAKANLIGVSKTNNICGGDPEYGIGSPTDCILPVHIDTGNNRGTISLSLTINQVPATNDISLGSIGCPTDYTLTNSVCYQASDFTSQLAEINTLSSDLSSVVSQLTDSVNSLKDVQTKIDAGQQITQDDINKIQDTIDKANVVIVVLNANKQKIADIKTSVSSEPNSAEIISQLDTLSSNYDKSISDTNSVITSLTDAKAKAVALLAQQSTSTTTPATPTPTPTSTTTNTSNGTQYVAQISTPSTTTTTSSTSTSTSSSISSSITKATDYVSTYSNSTATSTGTVNILGYDISYTYLIVGALIILAIVIFLFKRR